MMLSTAGAPGSHCDLRSCNIPCRNGACCLQDQPLDRVASLALGRCSHSLFLWQRTFLIRPATICSPPLSEPQTAWNCYKTYFELPLTGCSSANEPEACFCLRQVSDSCLEFICRYHNVDGVSSTSLSLSADGTITMHEGLRGLALDFKLDGSAMARPLQFHAGLAHLW